ncbi:dual specificity phosphatase [Annulohypoxylon truncatum]|uniref:dual specificity phosphatase n=1 Tax=Annulohypoxylon truncatum TaxID=327061 RepID=UPI0020082E26|nr:dual specificity phosphatase [Annulohypoxylon truncatum]KAI1212500.1 dual specificity phosphatase [Annulohypoxylon truncatum]
MPSATARRLYEDQIPSFMSIFDPETDNNIEERGLVTMVDPKLMEMESSCAPGQLPGTGQFTGQLAGGLAQQQQHTLRPLPNDPAHRHHDSTSTQNSESADSSPTTTLTTDTSSLSDPSPSSSPDSPVNLIPLNSFPATNFGGLPSTMDSLTVNDSGKRERPMTSPSPRRARNMKGLSIQPPLASSLSSQLVSEPSSPAFIKPKIPAMKRKPSQLSLKTDSTGLNMRPTALEVPGSPILPPIIQRRSLKHSTSSPHMLFGLNGLKSATFGPSGGMTFPPVLERGTSGLSEILRPTKLGSSGPGYDTTILEEDSPIKTQLANRAAMDFEPFIEPENNEDQKSPGYPDGPIAIYEDNVYLYLEPTAEEASKFDVVINVAREVTNPFQAMGKEPPAMNVKPIQTESPIPDTAMTNDSFATAFEFPPSEQNTVETPTTPKANPFSEPEYIHMPWDHNTDIATDLMMLCETIEKRTKDGKKVLVHCQQGASRSASLIIAYGLYQNPGLTVNDAYYAAQSKSKWISPNMRLMYCLQDFQKEVSKKKLPPRSAAGPRSGRSPTKHRLTLSANAIDMQPKEPMTAPLPDEKDGTDNGSNNERVANHSRGKSTPNLEAISPGPSSAPSSFSWSEKEDEKDPGKHGRFNFGNSLEPPRFFEPQPSVQASQTLSLPPPSPAFFKPPPSPGFFKPPPSPGFAASRFGEGPQSFGFSSLNFGPTESHHERPSSRRELTIAPALPEDDDALMSPRAETMTNNPLHDSYSELAGMKFVEVPPTPSEGLFSPRQTMFPRDPLFPFGRPAQTADPRSPPTKGETPIVRSIDDFL